MDDPIEYYGKCEECKQENTGDKYCKACNVKHFQQNFKNWTSGNNDIDKFIQDTQLTANFYDQVLEWIPYDKLYNINYISKDGFGKVYRAKWIDGYINRWDNINKNWERFNSNGFVTLKSLNNSENVTLEFINEIIMHLKTRIPGKNFIVRVYGITQDPEAKNYMMVLSYAENGSLRNDLDRNYYELTWEAKLKYLLHITLGLQSIHESELIHRDLHIGNILSFGNKSFENQVMVTGMGLCKPAVLENTKNSIYGVLPYVAPEVLRGQNYTKAADIYSFGIIMYEVISGLPPYHDVSHDKNLAIKICQGLRPRFSNIKVPQLIVNLIKRCLDANPLNRPTANEVQKVLRQWIYGTYDDRSEIEKQIKEAEEISNSLPTSSVSYETHPEAIYISRLLNFNNLPEPKNSDDYYDEQNDNIISEKSSESFSIGN